MASTAQLQQQVNTLTAQVASLQATVTQLQAAINAQEAKITTLTQERDVARAALAECQAQHEPPPPAQTITALTATPASITAGKPTVIAWQTSNATAVRLNGNVVALSGTLTATPAADTTYTIEVDGSAATITRSVSVAVTQSDPVPATTLPLNQPGFVVDLGVVPDPDPATGGAEQYWGYSGMDYSPEAQAVVAFGGGHSAPPFDFTMRFPLATLKWERDYDPTPLSSMVVDSNADGKPDYLTPEKFWQVPGQQPPLRPVGRHTYSGFLNCPKSKRLVCLMSAEGAPYGPAWLVEQMTGGVGAEFDPVAKTWVALPGVPFYAPSSYVIDPVSGNYLVVDGPAHQLIVFDPQSRTLVARKPMKMYGPAYIAEPIVYYPPNDRFYLFANLPVPGTGAPGVFEFTLNRTTWVMEPSNQDAGQIGRALATNWRPVSDSPMGSSFIYRYDEAVQLIVGGLCNGIVYGFKPTGNNTGQWLQQTFGGDLDGHDYHQAYVAALNTHIFITRSRATAQLKTHAFRWNPATATIPVDTVVHQPTATITVGGQAVATMQAACDVGGNITVSAGELRYADPCAHVYKPVRIVGSNTDMQSQGIEGKGIFVVDADFYMESVWLSGARNGESNGAGIRYQGGNMTLKKCRLHDNQNGLLAGFFVGSFSMDDCDVYSNGAGDGYSHGVYIGNIDSVAVSNSRFWDNKIGHHLKIRAKKATVTNCQLGTDFNGTESYNVDFPNGGLVSVTGCYLRQGANTDNSVMMNYGGEGELLPAHSFVIDGCTFESKDVQSAIGVRVNNDVAALGASADIRNCTFLGAYLIVAQGPHTFTNCTLNGAAL